MGAGKWIGGILGFMTMGPLGALAGFALGSLLDGNNGLFGNTYEKGQAEAGNYDEGQRNSFLFSMLVMASYIIRADGRIMHSEIPSMNVVHRLPRTCLTNNGCNCWTFW